MSTSSDATVGSTLQHRARRLFRKRAFGHRYAWASLLVLLLVLTASGRHWLFAGALTVALAGLVARVVSDTRSPVTVVVGDVEERFTRLRGNALVDEVPGAHDRHRTYHVVLRVHDSYTLYPDGEASAEAPFPIGHRRFETTETIYGELVEPGTFNLVYHPRSDSLVAHVEELL